MSHIKSDLSIIIVSYNTRQLLRDCLTAVYNSRLGSYRSEVLVYDNCSTDGSADMIATDFPQVLLLRGKSNLGFSKANNIAIGKSAGKYILLLNSDTKLNPDTLKIMLDFMQNTQAVAAATCKLVLPSGQIDPACHRGFPTPWAALTYFLKLEKLFPKSQIFGQYHQGYKGFDNIHEIDSPSGAFFLVRREVIDDIGLLDEDYFMYGEDLDWAYRMKNRGYRIYYNPAAICLHLKKQSGRANGDYQLQKATRRHFYQTMALFYTKHYSRKYPVFVFRFVDLIIRILVRI